MKFKNLINCKLESHCKTDIQNRRENLNYMLQKFPFNINLPEWFIVIIIIILKSFILFGHENVRCSNYHGLLHISLQI